MQIGVPFHDIPLHHIDFWVQAYNLSVGFMTELVGKHLGNYIGEFIHYDPSNNLCVLRSYMRLRVLSGCASPAEEGTQGEGGGGESVCSDFQIRETSYVLFLCVGVWAIVSKVVKSCFPWRRMTG